MVYLYSLHKSQSYNCYTESDTVCRLSFYRLYCIETLCWLQEKTNIFHPLVCHRRLNTYQEDFKEQDEFILFFKSSWCNSSYSSNRPSAHCTIASMAAAELNQFCPPKQKRRSSPLLLFVSFFYGLKGGAMARYDTVPVPSLRQFRWV